MKISEFEISNFRGIVSAKASDLRATVIIAGQNGSGKSCILDALRLLKSAYGGYQQNEWHQWMGEFSINVNTKRDELVGIFNDPKKPVQISFRFELHPDELSYIQQNLDDLLLDHVFRTHIPEAYGYGAYYMARFASQFREREPEMRKRADELKPKLQAELAQPSALGVISVQPGGRMNVSSSLVLPIVFSAYLPQKLGILDYHGPQRHYGRDPAQNVNINLDQGQQNQSAHALYNYSNKYQNVKSEMAASYVREILAEQAGVPRASQNTLTETLQSLFVTFFPDKRFLGPVPTADGALSFPVVTPGGNEHDLDELSSGEKEILYGYLRMRNSAPRFSVILIDEPELHLNPRLIRGLPQFYSQHLGTALDNQIWLITHSDALLREAVGNEKFNVFHMQPCSLSDDSGHVIANKNQLKPLGPGSDLDLAVADLVGDLAAYQPDRRVVIFEGGGDTDFDKWMTATLFPAFAQKVNLISGSNKAKVAALHEILDRAFERGEIKTKFYGIVDADYDETERSEKVRLFSWPVYHIENFLIDIPIIARVVSTLLPNTIDTDALTGDLRDCASKCIPKAIRHEVISYVSKHLTEAIDLSYDPKASDVSGAVYAAAGRSAERSKDLMSGALTQKKIKAVEDKARIKFEKAIADGSWAKKLPGRDILKAYSNLLPNGISHETLRLMIVNRMAEEKYVPASMAKIISKIEAAG